MASKWKTVKPLCFDGEAFDNFIPAAPGCYAVYADGVLIYVGQSTNLYNRIFNNHGFNFARFSSAIETPWGRCRDLTIKYRPSIRCGDWAMIELRLIKRLQPMFNCAGSNNKKRKQKLSHEESERIRLETWIFPPQQ